MEWKCLVAGVGPEALVRLRCQTGVWSLNTPVLKSASTVTGPYSAVAGASSPYSVAPTQAAEFYIAE